MKRVFLIVLFLFCLIYLPEKVTAIYDPSSVANNKYGIHIIDQNDLNNAANLVNSSGGDWGYVTMVMTINDLNRDKWQNIFDNLRELHLIPLIRLATELDGNSWRKPELNQASQWAEFLDSMNWVVKNRYVIIFNEPNHAKEWGGKINPEEYTAVLASYSATLKSKNPDFFILPAGLDASARNSSMTMDEETFVNSMVSINPKIFEIIDGWTSHSYPPISGNYKKYANGRESLETYKWESNLLKNTGLTGQLPVFITETGWPHLEGIPNVGNYLTAEKVDQLWLAATSDIANDPSVAAFTPFILNYQSYPFANFSWQKPNSDEFYPQFKTYQNLAKIKGEPLLEETPTATPVPTLSISANDKNIKGAETINRNSGLLNIFGIFFSKSKNFISQILRRVS